MIGKIKIFIAVMFFMLTSGIFLNSFAWVENDIVIWSGDPVKAFDVDYDKNTGEIFLAFQVSGENVIRLFHSTDHGYSWQQMATLPTFCRLYGAPTSDIKKLRILYNDNTQELHYFFVGADGHLCANRKPISSPVIHVGKVNTFTAYPSKDEFEVALNLETGRLVVANFEYDNYNRLFLCIYASDGGNIWEKKTCFRYVGSGGAIESLTYGPPNNFYLTYSYPDSFGKLDIYMRRSTDDGEHWSIPIQVTNDAQYQFQSKVAAANVDNSIVWVFFDESPYGYRGIKYRYTTDKGNSWSPKYTVFYPASGKGCIEDVKFYKTKPNAYIDFIYSYISSDYHSRKLYWRWTSSNDPSHTHGIVEVTDKEINMACHGGETGLTPKIVYSPGASAPGGGVVFADTDGHLYFDAPWVFSTPSHVRYHITVTINGSGRVTSDPPGLNCVNTDPTSSLNCTFGFDAGTTVTLTATPINGTLTDGTPYTSHFYSWSGDCSGDGSCTLTMDENKEVTATFSYLIPPVAAVIPLPTTPNYFEYNATSQPIMDIDPSLIKPIGVEYIPDGNFTLKVGLFPFEEPVDIYFAIYAPSIVSELLIVKPDSSLQLISEGLVPWKSNIKASISETLYTFPAAFLPSGDYYFFLGVVPAGEDFSSAYYIWSTHLLVP